MLRPPSRFVLRRSPTLVAWLAAVHGGALLAVWGSAMPAAAAGILTVLAVASFLRGIRVHALRSANCAVIWVEFLPDLRLGYGDGTAREARLRGHPLVHPWLVNLQYESASGRGVVLIPPDSLSSRDGHRTLRRILRHGGSA